MRARVAVELIRGAVAGHGLVWADLGAGQGTFTRALATVLGPASTIYAVDRDARAVAALEQLAGSVEATVVPVAGDFTAPLHVRGLARESLDGMLVANALHFAERQEQVLARLCDLVRPGGRVVLVEYDQRAASRWVPYPIGTARLPALAAAASLLPFEVAATRPSEYSGTIYCATATKPG